MKNTGKGALLFFLFLKKFFKNNWKHKINNKYINKLCIIYYIGKSVYYFKKDCDNMMMYTIKPKAITKITEESYG